MSDKEQVRVVTEEFLRCDMDLSQRLIALGFDPQIPLYAVQGGFSQRMISDALFEGTLSEPGAVPFSYRYGKDWSNRSSVDLPMEVESIQIVWVQLGGVHNYDDLPEWYIRGWLGQSSLNPDGEPIRMHAYISQANDTPECPATARVQMVRKQPSRQRRFSLNGELLVVSPECDPRIF